MSGNMNLQALDKIQITNLLGGRQRGEKLFIETEDEVLYYGKLENQMQSQRSPTHTEGYEPFLTKQGRLIYDIARERVEIPMWKRLSSGGGYQGTVEKRARLLKPGPSTAVHYILLRRAQKQVLRDRVLELIRSDIGQAGIVADLMAQVDLGIPPSVRRAGDPLELIESLYIDELTREQLVVWRDLLKVPRSLPYIVGKAA
jgi:hypothetical protein